MGKRSTFDRVPRDFYPTPPAALTPLLTHLAQRTVFIEPCAGNGQLSNMLMGFRHLCADQFDIEPKHPVVRQADALTEISDGVDFDCFITNPPWSRDVLHPLITHLSNQAPAWLLFDADWIHTRQAVSHLNRLRRIVSVGRVKWIPDSPFTGKDNCCWYLFDRPDSEQAVSFYGRTA